MSRRDKYTVELKPSVLDIKQTYFNYPELKNLLENSSYDDSGFFILNNNKMFDDDKRLVFVNIKLFWTKYKILKLKQ